MTIECGVIIFLGLSFIFINLPHRWMIRPMASNRFARRQSSITGNMAKVFGVGN